MEQEQLPPFVERGVLEWSQWSPIENFVVVVVILQCHIQGMIQHQRLANHQVVRFVSSRHIKPGTDVCANEKHTGAYQQKQQDMCPSSSFFFRRGRRESCFQVFPVDDFSSIAIHKNVSSR